MTQALIVVGSLVFLVSLVAVVVPVQFLRVALNVTVNTQLRVIGFVMRAGIGVFLILAAPSTDFSLALKILGVLSIVAGTVPLVLGNARSQWLLHWYLRRGPPAIVVAGLAGLVLGAFLVYAGT